MLSISISVPVDLMAYHCCLFLWMVAATTKMK
jgi:hypothetical protein